MPNLWTDESAHGPNPYATGGFDIVTGLTTVAFFSIGVEIAGNIGQASFDIALNTPSAGSVRIKVMQTDYDQQTTIGSPTGYPAGVTNRTSSGGTYDTVSHTHTMDHNHAVTPASGAPTGATAFTLALALQPNSSTHTHTVDLPNFTASVVAESAHTHTWNNIFQHQHALTNTQTDTAAVELANGTNLSTSRFNYLASDG